jgi:hypothetical protein
VSVEALSLVLHHSRATGTAKLVLIGIANHEGDGGSFPAVGTLGVYAGIDATGVRRHVRKLQQLGEVAVEFNEGGSRGQAAHMRPNLYRVLVTCPDNCDRTSSHRLLCLTCNEPLTNRRREAGTCKPGTCCPLSGELASRMGQPRCFGDANHNHAPGLCAWPADED